MKGAGAPTLARRERRSGRGGRSQNLATTPRQCNRRDTPAVLAALAAAVRAGGQHGTVGMTAREASALRMGSLLLTGAGDGEGPRTVAEVVGWFGAMQAQDYASGLWSLGCRLPGWTRADVEDALERREALRTWPMRGTLHLVPARDARWMLELMGGRALAGAAKRRTTLGLDEATAERAVEVLSEALAEQGRLTRAACVATLERDGIPAGGSRGYHLLWYASQRGVLCLAPNRGSEQTFVRLDAWVPDPHRLSRDEALALIAQRYVRSHGPVTRRDFIGWTGLTAADTDAALSLSGDALTAIEVEGVDMVVAADVLQAPDLGPHDDDIHVLPGFDEYLLGFKDRSLVLDPAHAQTVVPGGNGVFQPTLVRGAKVVGTWKRTTTRARTVVTIRPLTRLRAGDRRGTEAAFARYAGFLGTAVDIRWS